MSTTPGWLVAGILILIIFIFRFLRGQVNLETEQAPRRGDLSALLTWISLPLFLLFLLPFILPDKLSRQYPIIGELSCISIQVLLVGSLVASIITGELRTRGGYIIKGTSARVIALLMLLPFLIFYMLSLFYR